MKIAVSVYSFDRYLGSGEMSLSRAVEASAELGFAGRLSVEHESAEDPMTGLVRSRANLQEMVSSLS